MPRMLSAASSHALMAMVRDQKWLLTRIVALSMITQAASKLVVITNDVFVIPQLSVTRTDIHSKRSQIPG